MKKNTKFLSVSLSVIYTNQKKPEVLFYSKCQVIFKQTKQSFHSMKRNGNFKAIFSKIFEFASNHLSMGEQLGLDIPLNHLQ